MKFKSEEHAEAYIKYFDLSDDDDKEEGNLPNSYFMAIKEFGEKWADKMEEQIDNGHSLEDIAKKTEDEAIEGFGLSGNQYGAAVGTLSRFWVHGNRLRIWHNNKFGDRGKEANEKGGTINPALVTITVKDCEDEAPTCPA